MSTHQCIAMPMKRMQHDRAAYDGAFDYQCDAASNAEARIIFSARYLKENPHRVSIEKDCCFSIKAL
jgi:hypothetical protein